MRTLTKPGRGVGEDGRDLAGGVRRKTARSLDAPRRARFGDGGSGLDLAMAPRGDSRRTFPTEIVSTRCDICVVEFRGARTDASRGQIRSSCRIGPIRPQAAIRSAQSRPDSARFGHVSRCVYFSYFATGWYLRCAGRGRAGEHQIGRVGALTETTLRRSAD